jgi:hypothetical protein
VDDQAKWPLTVEPDIVHKELCNKMGVQVQAAQLACYFAHEKKSDWQLMVTSTHICHMFFLARVHLNSTCCALATVYLIVADIAVSLLNHSV